jgi:N-acetylglucosamine-6-phosphate deacetylase
VKNLGLSPEDAFQMASSVPANFLKLGDDLGQLKFGKKANFILLNEALEVQASFVEGQKIY